MLSLRFKCIGSPVPLSCGATAGFPLQPDGQYFHQCICLGSQPPSLKGFALKHQAVLERIIHAFWRTWALRDERFVLFFFIHFLTIIFPVVREEHFRSLWLEGTGLRLTFTCHLWRLHTMLVMSDVMELKPYGKARSILFINSFRIYLLSI